MLVPLVVVAWNSVMNCLLVVFAAMDMAPNAAAQARQTAEARHERTLFAVAYSRLFGLGLCPSDAFIRGASQSAPE